MTEQEALDLFKHSNYMSDYSWQDDMAELAIKALEKQTPKEPKKESMCSGNAFDFWDKYNCPDCNNFLHSGARSLVSKYTIPKYCCRCGQALKWE